MLATAIPVFVAMLAGFVLPGRITIGLCVIMLVMILTSAYLVPGSSVPDAMINVSFIFLFTLPFLGLAGIARAGYKRLFSADEPFQKRWDLK